VSRKFGFQNRLRVQLSPKAAEFERARHRSMRSSDDVRSMLTEAPYIVARRREAEVLAALKDARRERRHQAALAKPTSKRLRKFLKREERRQAHKEGRRPRSQIERHAHRMAAQPTRAESCVARTLRRLGVKFQSQHIVGQRILDFYLPQHDIAIEADGAQHFTTGGIADDARRERQLAARYPGIQFIRLENRFILNHRRLGDELRARIRAIQEARLARTEILLEDGRVERYSVG
jgi:very-short-patch-repair endonuclease